VGRAGLGFSNVSKVSGQVLRSVSDWSCGCKVERSIYNCMLGLIEKAEHCIYIENQYFCAGFQEGEEGEEAGEEGNEAGEQWKGGGGRENMIVNGIGLALINRISKAVERGEIFRVVVVMPHLAFENNPVQSTILGFQNKVIREIEAKLKARHAEVLDWKEYISFYNLRNHGKLNNPGTKVGSVMEEIYLHDKLMIVDDRAVLIGSANVNDRSLLGTRDSEIAVVLYGEDMVDSRMAGKEWRASK